MTDGMRYEDLPKKDYSGKSKKSTAKIKNIKPKKVTNMSKEQYKRTKSAHKAEIGKLKAKRAQLARDIKRHKILIKQAKFVYKISKMKEKEYGGHNIRR
jgi:hypothetical protein